MASYKKKPKNLEPIWCFSMKAAFCWSPVSPEPGHPVDRRLFCGALAADRRFRQSPAYAFPQKGSGSHSMPSSTATRISGRLRWSVSLGTSSNICGDTWSFFGIVVDLIKEAWLKSFLKSILVFIPNGSPDIPRNSIPMNSFGTILSVRWRMARQKTSTSLRNFYTRNSCACGGLRNCYGHAFTPLICRGPSFYYLCVAL